MKPIFSAEDFDGKYLPDNNAIAKVANFHIQKLIESWKVVYGFDGFEDGWEEHKFPEATHQARLAFIEPIQKKECEHTPYPVSSKMTLFKDQAWECAGCGAKLKATWSVDE